MGRAYEVRKSSIAKTGAIKSKLYAMYSKEIYNAAKKGGIDPGSNQNLKRLIENSKREQIPSDIIKRAIDKVSSGVQENYTNLRYEGFGPGSSTLIIDCLTDNTNRTISYIRGAFAKGKAKLGSSGCVAYTYDNLCVISFEGLSEEKILEVLIDNDIDIEDIEIEEEHITLYGKPNDVHKIKEAIISCLPEVVFEKDEIMMIPHERVNLNPGDQDLFEKLLKLLEDIDDVGNVYHNVELR